MPTRVGTAENGDVTELMIKQPNQKNERGQSIIEEGNGGGRGSHTEGPQTEDKDCSTPPTPIVLETRTERRARRISHLVAYITTFNMAIGFSIILTGVWPYLQKLSPGVSKQSLGWVISANPLGQMVASPLLGYWGNRAGSNRGAFLLSMVLFAIGNGLYAILSVFGSAAMTLMIFSRFLVGVSSANIAIIRSYIAASTTLQERTLAVALTSASQGLGFIFGPAIQTALAVAFTKETQNSTVTPSISEALAFQDPDGPGIEFNMYTATGWIGVVLGLLNCVLFLPCVFKEHPIAAKEAELHRQASKKESLKIPKPDYVGLICILSSFFLFLMIYVLLETLLVPMCIDLYAWTDEFAVTVAGIGLSIAGALAIVSFLLAGFLSRHFDERKVLIFCGIIPMTLAMFVHFPMGNTYPKIKNCTVAPFPTSPVTSGTLASTQAPKQGGISTLASTQVPGDALESLASIKLPENPELLASIRKNMSEITLASSQVPKQGGISTLASTQVPETTQSLKILLGDLGKNSDIFMNETGDYLGNSVRRRRFAVTENSCDDLGCPAEQAWCSYTPIIEKSQLIVGNIIALIGYPIAFTLSSSIFSKLLGPKPQGVWMGILTSTGSFSRVTGPIIVTYMYTDLGTRWTFAILFFIMIGTLICNIIFYKRMVPMKIDY